jgi:hypothetical protein
MKPFTRSRGPQVEVGSRPTHSVPQAVSQNTLLSGPHQKPGPQGHPPRRPRACRLPRPGLRPPSRRQLLRCQLPHPMRPPPWPPLPRLPRPGVPCRPPELQPAARLLRAATNESLEALEDAPPEAVSRGGAGRGADQKRDQKPLFRNENHYFDPIRALPCNQPIGQKRGLMITLPSHRPANICFCQSIHGGQIISFSNRSLETFRGHSPF